MHRIVLSCVIAVLIAGPALADITYDYYPGEQHSMPDFTALKAEKTGTIANFDMTLGGVAAEENYAIRFQGGLKIEKDGVYTFHLNSDDGSKLWIDDKLVIDNDGDHGAFEKSGRIKLAAGIHKIVLGFYQGGGERELALAYEGGGIARTAIPKEALSAKVPAELPGPPKDLVDNVAYEYFEGEYEKLPDSATLTAAAKGTVYGFDPGLDGKARTENYAIRFTSQIKIEKEGEYTFWTNSDDGSKLLIDDKEIVNNDGIHGALEKEGKVKLTADQHKITVLYLQRGGDRALKVGFAGPGIEKCEIPDAALSAK